MIVTIVQARQLTEAVMRAAGYSPAEAEVIADHLVDCELRGLSFGGLARALSVIDRLKASAGKARPITLLHETAVSATLDGGDQVGYLVGRWVTDIAIAKAKTSGVAVIGAKETWYTGMFSYYLEMLTKQDLVGIVAGSGGHFVAPAGGTERRLGTNPIAFGFPAADGPIIWDIGTAGLMLGEVILAMRLGQQLPPNSGFDAAGAATSDPTAILQGGAVGVWGGHKGSGLALVVQLLGMLCGASAAPDGLRDCGLFMVAIDPAILTSVEDFKERASIYARSIRTTRPVDPEESVRLPFDRSRAQRERHLAEGSLSVSDQVWTALSAIANLRDAPATP